MVAEVNAQDEFQEDCINEKKNIKMAKTRVLIKIVESVNWILVSMFNNVVHRFYIKKRNKPKFY